MSIIGRAGNVVLIGLEEKNLEKLRAGQPFHRAAAETGIPFDIVIFYGKTFEDLQALTASLSGPDTVVVDKRGEKKH